MSSRRQGRSALDQPSKVIHLSYRWLMSTTTEPGRELTEKILCNNLKGNSYEENARAGTDLIQ